MTKRKRRAFSGKFKSQVALEAIKGLKSVNQIAAEHEIHPVQVSKWKKELLEHSEEIFQSPTRKDTEQGQREAERLERKVGQLTMQVDWLKKKCKELNLPLDDSKW